ncbi:MAG TPA: UDP-N-acetylmuramoyl-L-alanyl-D-glutamate--2,6-diaminopimelate ligase [Ktedonobacterales bacterium]
MRMRDMLATLAARGSAGPLDGEITGITNQSDMVTPGACFVAISGRRADGHRYIGEACARGAALVVGEAEPPPDLARSTVYVRVADARSALATLAGAYYRYPSRRLNLIGVTGTDGKTTTVNLIERVLRAGGRRCDLMSTVDRTVGGARQPNASRFTTPEAPEIEAALAEMLVAGAESVVLETTSAALEMGRVAEIAFDSAVLTNITLEHLEVHGTLERYRRAKAMLFEAIDPARRKPATAPMPHVCVLNADDSSCAYIRPFCRAEVLTYGIERPADVRAERLALSPHGARFRVCLPDGGACEVVTALAARFNVSNCLAAIAVGYAHGIAPQAMAEALASFRGVPGRMQRLDLGQPFTVIVDYAHTPDSLEKMLRSLRAFTAGRLIVLFGSAGERDRAKRPLMGAVAARLADLSVITDEDPRFEDPAAIRAEIAAGALAAGGREGQTFWCIADRQEAIAVALGLARTGDTVLLAGKGHERTQLTQRGPQPWDEAAIARAALSACGSPA